MFSHGHVSKLKAFNYTEFSSLTASKKNKINDEHFGISQGQRGSIMVTIPFNCCLYRGVSKMKSKVSRKVSTKHKPNNQAIESTTIYSA